MSIIGKTARFVAGLGLGAGLGAVTALLLAPQSGEISLAQVQSRVDAILRAGRTAAQQREDELYDAWEVAAGVLALLVAVFFVVHYPGAAGAEQYAGLLLPVGVVALLSVSLWSLARRR